MPKTVPRKKKSPGHLMTLLGKTNQRVRRIERQNAEILRRLKTRDAEELENEDDENGDEEE